LFGQTRIGQRTAITEASRADCNALSRIIIGYVITSLVNNVSSVYLNILCNSETSRGDLPTAPQASAFLSDGGLLKLTEMAQISPLCDASIRSTKRLLVSQNPPIP
jgi:hypothetical protein